MNGKDFTNKWKDQKDPDGTSRVGIVVNWEEISLDAKVLQYSGKKAWNKIKEFAPPWHHEEGVVRPFSIWIGSEKYLAEIEREKLAGKLKYYEEHGLEYPFFCVFANKDGSKGIVGDGNHRFVNIIYLIDQGKDMESDIIRCTLEILCLDNLSDVIQDKILPGY